MKLHKYTFNYLYLLFAAVVASTAPANAVADTATELAKKTQNPVSNLISVPFENNANFRAGPDNKVLNVLNIKPVIPIKLNDNWNLINRAILPLISQPGVDGTPIGRKNGVGDLTYQGFSRQMQNRAAVFGGLGHRYRFLPTPTAGWVTSAGRPVQIWLC